MSEEIVLKKICDSLLKIVSHTDKPNIIFIEIETGGSEVIDEGIVPYVNMYGNAILNNHNLDSTIQKAIDENDFGYIIDILDNIIWDDYEIKLIPIYPEWPNQRDLGDEKIITTIKQTIKANSTLFEHINKLYFHYAGSFDFIKLIDKPV